MQNPFAKLRPLAQRLSLGISIELVRNLEEGGSNPLASIIPLITQQLMAHETVKDLLAEHQEVGPL
jgi:hypothetical protein